MGFAMLQLETNHIVRHQNRLMTQDSDVTDHRFCD